MNNININANDKQKNIYGAFLNKINQTPQAPQAPHATTTQSTPKGAYDSFVDKFVKKEDLNDTVTVPRNIYKGYMSFMIATSIGTMNSFIKNTNNNKTLGGIKTAVNILASAIGLHGTYQFTKGLIIKQNETKK